MPVDNIGLAVFLLDVYCLGVKGAFYVTQSLEEYASRIKQFESHGALTTIHPACARKLIERAVLYAKQLGFKPHKDYTLVKRIFGEIDPETCPTEFEYGSEGKPFYVSGPNDSPQKSQAIINTLMKRCGPDGFHYMVGTGFEQQ